MNDTVIWITLGILMLAGIGSSINMLRKDISHINITLEKIAKQIGVPEPSVDDEIQSLVVDGKKIKAIKIYRQATGLGLKEAKEYVDNLEQTLK